MPNHALTFHPESLIVPAVIFFLGAALMFAIRRDAGSSSIVIASLSTYIVVLASILLGMLLVLLLHRESETFWFYGLLVALLLPFGFSARKFREQRGKAGVAYGRWFALTAALILLVLGLFGSLYAFKY